MKIKLSYIFGMKKEDALRLLKKHPMALIISCLLAFTTYLVLSIIMVFSIYFFAKYLNFSSKYEALFFGSLSLALILFLKDLTQGLYKKYEDHITLKKYELTELEKDRFEPSEYRTVVFNSIEDYFKEKGLPVKTTLDVLTEKNTDLLLDINSWLNRK